MTQKMVEYVELGGEPERGEAAQAVGDQVGVVVGAGDLGEPADAVPYVDGVGDCTNNG
ncbi:hypothetical protein ABNF97_29850 [Plantactinospora sp. B6F1]|uniref:hypothetical protein n=1 Tax=Plantactinospora sp. B6F1 TaxID=3158971 RepID=UPI0032D96D7A